MASANPLLVTDDPLLTERVREVAAAVGVDVTVAATTAATGRGWGRSALVLLGDDVADDWLPGRRDGLVLVASTAGPGLWQRAALLGAARVLVLPGAEQGLAELLLESAGTGRPGQVVGVLGAVGGCGASTLAAALAAAGPRDRSVLVELDHVGAGAGLATGAGDEPGLRWEHLAAVRGALRPQVLERGLPCVDGVRLLCWEGAPGREESGEGDALPEGLLPLEAVRSVVVAARAAAALTVLDLPRRFDTLAAQQWRLLDAVVVVVPARVRAVVSARTLFDRLPDALAVHPVVRPGGRGAPGAGAVADALGRPVAGRWCEEARLAEAAERGDLLHASRSGRTGRLARTLVSRVGGSGTAEAAVAGEAVA